MRPLAISRESRGVSARLDEEGSWAALAPRALSADACRLHVEPFDGGQGFEMVVRETPRIRTLQ